MIPPEVQEAVNEREAIQAQKRQKRAAYRAAPKPYRIQRADGLFHKGPFYKSVFNATGKRFKTRAMAQRLIDHYNASQTDPGGPLVVVEG